MDQIHQAPLHYFHQLINLDGFEAERAKFYENVDNQTEHQPYDLVVDRDRHIISYSLNNDGILTPIQFHLDHTLNLQSHILEAANAIYSGLNTKPEKDQFKYKLHLRKELESMLHTIDGQTILREYKPLRECILELLKLLKSQPVTTDEVLSFRYQVTNQTRANKKLTDLHNALLLRKLIAPDTSLWDLKAVFQEKPIKRQVKWIGFNWQLTLLIKHMGDCITSKADKWVTATTCFLDRRGESFTNLKLGQPKYPKGKDDSRKEVIDIAEAFKPD